MAFGDTMKAAREAKGLTQDELAERLRVSRGTIWRWESGAGAPLIPDQLNDLVGALDLSAERALRELGVRLFPPRIAEIPRELQELLIEMNEEQHRFLLDLIRSLKSATEPAGARR